MQLLEPGCQAPSGSTGPGTETPACRLAWHFLTVAFCVSAVCSSQKAKISTPNTVVRAQSPKPPTNSRVCEVPLQRYGPHFCLFVIIVLSDRYKYEQISLSLFIGFFFSGCCSSSSLAVADITRAEKGDPWFDALDNALVCFFRP